MTYPFGFSMVPYVDMYRIYKEQLGGKKDIYEFVRLTSKPTVGDTLIYDFNKGLFVDEDGVPITIDGTVISVYEPLMSVKTIPNYGGSDVLKYVDLPKRDEGYVKLQITEVRDKVYEFEIIEDTSTYESKRKGIKLENAIELKVD